MVGRRLRVLAMVSVLAAGTARADTPAPGPADSGATDAASRTRQLFEQAQAHYDLGEYGEAIALFREAYQLSAAPALLFNIAQAHRLNGDCPRALQVYRHFVRLDPSSLHRAAAETQIANLESKCEHPTQRAAIAPSASASAGPPQRRLREVGAYAMPPVAVSSPAQGRLVLGLLSAGIVLAGVAAALHVWSDSRFDTWRVEDRTLYAWRPSSLEEASNRQQRQLANDNLLGSVRRGDTIAAALGIAGGASLVAGTGLFVAWQPVSLSNTTAQRAQIVWRGAW